MKKYLFTTLLTVFMLGSCDVLDSYIDLPSDSETETDTDTDTPITPPELDFPTDERIIGKPSDFEASEHTDDPRKWTFLSDNRLYGSEWDVIHQSPQASSSYAAAYTKDSLRNAWENYASGKITYFWDGVTEDETTNYETNSHFYTGPKRQNGIPGYWAYPYSYFIDLGRDVQLSRVTVHQAWDDGAIYGKCGTKVFQLYGRADGGNEEPHLLDNWEFIGTYTIEKPLNEADQMTLFLSGHTFDVLPADKDGVPQLSNAYRYIRFKGLEPFELGEENTWYRYSESTGLYYNGQDWSNLKDKPADAVVVDGTPYEAKMSEITFYGKDNYK